MVVSENELYKIYLEEEWDMIMSFQSFKNKMKLNGYVVVDDKYGVDND